MVNLRHGYVAAGITSFLLYSISATAAAEFLVPDNPVGTCSVEKGEDPGPSISLTLDGEDYFAGGFEPVVSKKGLGRNTLAKELDAGIIASCLGISDSSEVRFGVVGPDFSEALGSQILVIGFGFKLKSDVAIYEANTFYQIKVGGDFDVPEPPDFNLKPPNTLPVSDAGPDQTVAPAAAVTLNGSGSSDADSDALTYAWTQASGTTVTLSSATARQPTFKAPSLNVGDADAVLVFSLTVNDGTVSSSADAVTITVEAPSPTPATAFAEYEEEIRATLVDDASRTLRSKLSANQRLIRNARDRMIDAPRRVIECRENQNHEDTLVGAQSDLDLMECEPNSGISPQNAPLDIDGKAEINNLDFTTQGSFFEQTANPDGTARRLFFGDFDVHHDSDTESTTATLSARVAWEHMTTDTTLLGYFIGGELARSDISGAFNGDQDRSGVIVGGYAVHQLDEELFLDGFISYGVGRNELEMSNDVLALTSDHSTRATTAGIALTGVFDYQDYQFRPELAFNYGKTWIGVVDFTGRAYGLVDDTLSLDAGSVSIANVTLRPELIWALDADTVAESHVQFSFAPRAICGRTITTTRIENCGGGAELGLSSVSEDESRTAEFRLIVDRLGDTTRSSAALNLEQKF